MITPTRRAITLGAVALALWGVVAVVVMPMLIRQAYAGESAFAPLNQVIKGQAAHPVDYYVGLWSRAATTLTLAGLALAAFLVVAWTRLTTIAAGAGRVLRSAPVVGLADMVRVGLCIGFVGGLAETSSLAVRFLFRPDPREAPPVDALWMAPLSTAILGAIVCLVLGVMLRAWRGVSIVVPFALLSGFAAFSVIKGLKLGVHPYAAMLLAAGIAVELSRRSRQNGAAVTRFVRRAVPAIAVTLLLGAAATRGVMWGRERAALAEIEARPASAPNVLLLILDTVRAASLGLYGYERNTTPEIQRLAATGVTFDHAIVSAPWTLPSHASMFTGLPPHRLSTDFDRPLDGAAPTLAEVLHRRGYATGGFVANPTYASRASGLDRGFATYRDHTVSVGSLIDNAFWPRLVSDRVRDALGMEGRLVRKTAEEVNRELLSWVPTDGRPFFAFLNYFDAHEPYETHPPFDLRFSKHPPKFWLVKGWQRRKSREDLQEIRNAYDSNIAYIDHHIGALVRALEARGLMRNTIVVVSSDHGEHLGEHGGIMSHANSLYLPLLHVPLVVSYPPSVPGGKRVTQPVSLQNIAATVLDILGDEGEASLPGTSLAPLWSTALEATGVPPAPLDRGVGPSAATLAASPPGQRSVRADESPVPSAQITTRFSPDTEAILSGLTYNTFSSSIDPIQKGPMHSLVRGSLHYIRNGDGAEELYDYVADPRERANLAEGVDGAAEDARLPELRQTMDQMLGETARRPRVPRNTRAMKRRAAKREPQSVR